MEDTIIIIVIIAIVIGSVIVPILFWAFIIKLFINHVSQFEKEERKLQALLNQYSKMHQDYANGVVDNSQLKNFEPQILAKLGKMQNHYNKMDSLRQQRSEARMSSMRSSVIAQGFTAF
jgi:Tfp pilus assembly protein PilO